MDKVTTSEFAASAIPVLRYRDLPAAIEWLCTALGFSRHHVVTGAKGVIIFAQLTLGKAMIMVGPVRQSAFDKFLKQPDEIDGAETQVCYFFVVDAHAHCARAKAAGAKIIFDIEDKANGGRSYSCRDPEGHLWNFGTYDPWRRQVVAHRQRSRMGWGGSRRVAALGLFIGVLTTITGLALAPNIQHKLGATLPADRSAENEVKMALDGLARERAARQAAERAEQEMRDRLTDARGSQATQHLRQLLAAERNRRRMAEKAAQEASHRLAEAQNAKDAAEQVAKEAHERLARMQLRKGAAERAASQAKRQLAMERNAKRAAEGQFTGSLPTATTTLPW